METKKIDKLDEDLCAHVFLASSAMVGVCITVIGIIQVVTTLRNQDSLGDNLLLLNAVLYLLSTIFSYCNLRTPKAHRHHLLVKFVDLTFICSLVFTTIVAGFITYEVAWK